MFLSFEFSIPNSTGSKANSTMKEWKCIETILRKHNFKKDLSDWQGKEHDKPESNTGFLTLDIFSEHLGENVVNQTIPKISQNWKLSKIPTNSKKLFKTIAFFVLIEDINFENSPKLQF
jgi:hypothetical protein